MTDEEIILHVFVWVDDHIGELSLDPKPGPEGRLSLSEVLTLMVLHHLLKPFWTLKGYSRWLGANWRHFFPHLVEYSRLTRLFVQAKDFLMVLLKKLSAPNSFGLVADGTALPVMHVRRGPYAKSFRDARKVYCASKDEWYWGFLLELVIDQAGQIVFFSVSVAAEIRQLTDILEDLGDRWLLGDKGNRGHDIHERLWRDKQIRIKITNGKERNWIENVIGVLKDKLGLDQIHVRKKPSLIGRVTAILCAYNLMQVLHLPL
jgi:Transposase DDE domain